MVHRSVDWQDRQAVETSRRSLSRENVWCSMCLYACVCTYAGMSVRLFMYVFVCMRVYMYACMYVCRGALGAFVTYFLSGAG